MVSLFSVLIILTCLLLVAIILIQNPKGGGLSSSFGGGGTQLFGGVKKTTDFLDRGTWVLAIALVALVLLSNVMLTPEQAIEGQQESELTDELQSGSMPIQSFPTGEVPAATPEDVSEAVEGNLQEPELEGDK